ncbi:hypothetical protein ACFXHA_41930 [Nocardia sp. NPDC059240]|uniref:hypothetical protein n=1 Tax=Nocardia sp. NPDC059240 TaxID=3346786 RepID=UPI003684DC48
MPKFTVRRTVAAGFIGAAALGVLAMPAVANAAAPDSIASLADTGSSGPAVAQDPGVLVTRDDQGNVTVVPAQPGLPGNAIPATPLQPAQPAQPGQHVIIQDDRGGYGDPSHTIILDPAR